MKQPAHDVPRPLVRLIASIPTSDGAGVKLRRSIGSARGLYLDPFLMLDEFSSDDAGDYIGGFPAHPHRGFETVTYMLDGHMLHEDNLGNKGHLNSGGVQWMSAGRGIIHAEMPQQESGRMHGFQLWINLPAAEKLNPAAYRDIPAEQIPEVELGGGAKVRVIAGRVVLESTKVAGPINAHELSLATDPHYFDVCIGAGSRVSLPVPAEHNAFVYAYEGEVAIGDAAGKLPAHVAGVLGQGNSILLSAEAAARAIVLAARPLDEPVVQYGPFVMNTHDEIEQALADYRAGRLA